MILVTGGCGYIGSHTIANLVENGFDVVSVDNFINSSAVVLDGLKAINRKETKNYNIDLCNIDATKIIFEENKIEAVIHFAALKMVGESVEQPYTYYYNNINSLINILELCGKYNVNKFIFSSSCSVYGNTNELPVTESTRLNSPQSPYAATKQMGEQIVNDFCKKYNIESVILRYFNPVGAHTSNSIGELPIGNPQNLFPAITQFAIGKLETLNIWGNDYNTKDGTCIRDYIHVCDIANAHTLSLQYILNKKNNKLVSVFNLGSATGTSVLDIITEFENNIGKKLNITFSPRRHGDVEAIYANNEKAKNILNWIPKYTLKDMVSTAWNWATKNA